MRVASFFTALFMVAIVLAAAFAQPPSPATAPPPSLSIPQPSFPFSEQESKEWNIIRIVEYYNQGRIEEFRLDAAPIPYPKNPAAIAALLKIRTLDRLKPEYVQAVNDALTAARAAGDIPAEAWALHFRWQRLRAENKYDEALPAVQQATDAWIKAEYYPGAIIQIGMEVSYLKEHKKFDEMVKRAAYACELATREKTRSYSLGLACMALASQFGLALYNCSDPVQRAALINARKQSLGIALDALAKLPPTVLYAEGLFLSAESVIGLDTNNLIGTDFGAIGLFNSPEFRAQMDQVAGWILKAREVYGILAPVSNRAKIGVPDCDSLMSTLELIRRDPVSGFQYSQKAVAGYRALSPEVLTPLVLDDILATISNAAGTARAINRVDEAEQNAKDGIALWKKALVKDPALTSRVGPQVAILYIVLGDVAQVRGDLSAAQEAYQEALALAPDADTLSRQSILASLGAVAQRRGDFELARDTFSIAIAQMKKATPSDTSVASVLVNRSLCRSKTRDATGAASDLNEARTLYERWSEKNPLDLEAQRGVADCIVRLGVLAHEQGREALNAGRATEASGKFETSLKLFDEARDRFARHSETSLEVARVIGNTATVLLDAGRVDEAQKRGLDALSLYDRLAPDSLECAYLLGSLADCLMQKGDIKQGILYAERGAKILERQRASIPNASKRALLTAQQTDIFPALVEGYLADRGVAQAFLALEQSRARALAESIVERDAETAQEMPEDLKKRWDSLERQRTVAYATLKVFATDSDPDFRQGVLTQLAELGRMEDTLIAETRQRAPGYAEIRYPVTLNLTEGQKQLPEGTLLLSYFVGPRRSFLFIITGGKTPTARVVTVSVTEAELTVSVGKMIDRINLPGKYPKDITRHLPVPPLSEELYALLLSPAEIEINRAKRLLICPDGPLNALPFAALMRKPAPGQRREYLIERKPLRVAPSLTLLAKLETARPKPTQGKPRLPILALGYPVWTPSPASPRPLPGITRNPARLGMKKEAQTIAALWGAKALIGPEATESALRTIGPQANILHLACHAVGGSKDPMKAHLSLVPTMESGTKPRYQYDGDIFSWELYTGRLRFSAELATLSACETGQGRQIRYEGVDSLARAFLVAGCRSVVYTLWEVNDETTGKVMTEFYRRLKAGEPRDEALRAAIVAVRNTYSSVHPFYWAAFQLTGAENPLR